MTEAETIRILHVDDEPAFVDLTADMLEREDDRFTVETATSPGEGLDHLADEECDCVVSDYDMPGTNGIELLEAVRDRYPDLPFILFTGKGSEEVASDAISAGVTDYLQKQSGASQYTVLTNRIENAVEKARAVTAQRRQIHAIESAREGIAFLNDDFEFTHVNDAYADLFSYDPSELTGESWRILYPKAGTEQASSTISPALQNDGYWHGETTLQRATGETFVADHVISATEGRQYVCLARDVTTRKERERELERYKTFVEATGDPMYALDTDGQVIFVNEALVELTGYNRDSLIGSQPSTFTTQAAIDHGESVIRSLLTSNVDRETFEFDVHTADGDQVPCECHVALLPFDDEFQGTVAVLRDITERNRRQRELERQNDLFAKAQDIADVGAWAHDTESETLRWTAQVYEMHGVSKDFDTSLENVLRLYHPDDQPKLREAVDQAVTEGKSYDLEVRVTARDDGTRWVRTVADPHTENGDVVRVRGTVHDITERKQREQEILKLKRQYQTLAKNFPNGAVFMFDDNLRYVRVGGGELEALGVAPDEIEGSKVHDIFPDQLADELAQYYTDTLEGNSHTFTQRVAGKTYRTWTVPVQIGDTDIDYGMGMSQNITGQIERRQELERKNKRLEEFASIVSHDLRSPLSIVEGRLELAQESCESDHLTRAADALDRSQALIDDLLTLAREGETVGELEPVDLADVAEDSWQTVETGSATLEAHGTHTLRADRSRLQELVENLYRNAVEHGGDGVTVSVGAMDDGFYVADTGPGIAEADREEVFEAGYSTNEDGTGFGLRIVKQIADAHGWEITVTESEQGGARFEISGVENGA